MDTVFSLSVIANEVKQSRLLEYEIATGFALAMTCKVFYALLSISANKLIAVIFARFGRLITFGKINMIKIIKKELSDIEKEFDIVIFYACESGSRAWGFESLDSDYDIRFLYYHDLDWYLSLKDKKDVIKRLIDEKLDINGWELRKALKLMRKSNPPLLEWFQSPIIYKEKKEVSKILKKVFPKYYSSKSCYYHYLHMAQGNFREYLKGDEVWIKKYFYVLRPILACRWIKIFNQPVPMEFRVLIEKTLDDYNLKKEIYGLLERKKAGEELDFGPKIASISKFIESEIKRLEENYPNKVEYKDFSELDEIFKEVITR